MGLSLHAGQVSVADGTDAGGRADPAHAARPTRDGDRAPRRRRLRRGDRRRRPARGADPDAMSALAIRGAAQVLRLPETGCPTCATTGRPSSRSSRATCRRRRRDRGARGRPGGDVGSTRRLRRASPASSTATRTCRSPAGARRSTSARSPACPTRRSRAPAAGSPSSARALAAASRRGGARAGRGARRARCSRHGTTAFEGKTGYGLARDGRGARRAAGPRARPAASPQPMTLTGLFAHAVPPGTTADAWMDERRRRSRARATSTRSTSSSSRSPSRTSTSRAWARSPRATGRPLRAHVEQLSTHALGAGRARRTARARSTTSSLIHPDDIAPLAAAECAAVLLPGAEVMNARAHRARARARRRGRDLRAGDRLQPGHLAGRVAAADHRPRRAPLRLERARGAARRHAQRRLGARPVDELGSLEPGKRADVLVLDGPAEHIPYRLGHNPVAAVIARRRARLGAARPGLAGDAVIAAAELRDRLAGLEPIGLGATAAPRGWPGRRSSPRPRRWFGEQARDAGPARRARPGRDRSGRCPDAPRAVVGDRLAPRQRAQRRPLRRRARRGGRVRGRRARAGASPCSPSPTRRARASTRRRSARARSSGGSTSPTRSPARDDDGVALARRDARGRRRPGRAGRRAGVARPPARLRSSCTSTRRSDLERLGAPAGAVARARRADAARRRRSRAAPTTPARRGATSARDALAAAARLIVAADELAGARPATSSSPRRGIARRAERVHDGARRACGSGSTRRTPDGDAARRVARGARRARAAALAAATASRSRSRPPRGAAGVAFDPAVLRRAAATCPSSSASPATTRASSPSSCPAGMVFVRNPTGVSHAPEEAGRRSRTRRRARPRCCSAPWRPSR